MSRRQGVDVAHHSVSAPNIAVMGLGLVLTILGARGSLPVSQSEMLAYGGRTTSYMIDLPGDHTVFIDAGTGLAAVQGMADGRTQHYDILLTHYHLDHLQGLQFFKPLYREGNTFTFRGHRPHGVTVEEAISGVSQSPWFPLPLDATLSDKTFRPVEETFELGPLTVRSAQLHHPQGVTGYRLEGPARSVVIATDHEAGDPEADARLVELASGANYLIHDAQYTPKEYEELYTGWGHSTWEHAVATATAAGVDALILTSHDPSHTDEDVDEILACAREAFPETHAAFEGMEIAL